MFVSSSANTDRAFEFWISTERSAVLCGNDFTLLNTRRMVLERSGISVQTALGIDALDETEGAVLILCYSLSKAEQQAAVEQYRLRLPSTRILLFSGESLTQFAPGCRVLDQYPGPRQFVKEVTAMLDQTPTISTH